MRRADAALELLLTQDEARAGEIAGELDLLNRERQDTELRITFAAEAELAAHAHEPAYVLAGEDWHPGVIGIVASRLVERHYRPCVLIALDGDANGRGSGRSISAFDLHGGLAACAPHLGRYGGHRMAAGFDIAADPVDAFRRDFVPNAARADSARPRPVQRVDALAPGASLGLDLAEELERLGRSATATRRRRCSFPRRGSSTRRAMGEEGQHAPFTVAAVAPARARSRSGRCALAGRVRRRAARRRRAPRAQRMEWHGRAAARAARALQAAPGRVRCARRRAWSARASRASAGAPHSRLSRARGAKDVRSARGGDRGRPRRPACKR